MTRLLFVPNPHTLIWLDAIEDPALLAEAIYRGEWKPPAPYNALSGSLVVYWQEGLVIASALPLRAGGSTTAITHSSLTRRQREILKGLGEGLTTHQIAIRLHIQPRTVYYQIMQLKKKLGLSNRAELSSRANEILRSR